MLNYNNHYLPINENKSPVANRVTLASDISPIGLEAPSEIMVKQKINSSAIS